MTGTIWVRLMGIMGTPNGYHKGSNRVRLRMKRLRMKRGTPPMTYNFWAYGTVKSDPYRDNIV